MRPGNDRAPGGGTEGATSSQVMTDAAFSVPEDGGTTAQTRPPITCRYAHSSLGAACGAFTTEQHERASRLGMCCVSLAFDAAGDGR